MTLPTFTISFEIWLKWKFVSLYIIPIFYISRIIFTSCSHLIWSFSSYPSCTCFIIFFTYFTSFISITSLTLFYISCTCITIFSFTSCIWMLWSCYYYWTILHIPCTLYTWLFCTLWRWPVRSITIEETRLFTDTKISCRASKSIFVCNKPVTLFTRAFSFKVIWKRKSTTRYIIPILITVFMFTSRS